MTGPRYEASGYPAISKDDMNWIVSLIESKVDDPDDIVAVGRQRDGLDLEICFEVAERSRHIFTPDVCLEITSEVAVRTGVLKPVIYVFDDPHPVAQESLDYAARRV